jgi:hypothetical protein
MAKQQEILLRYAIGCAMILLSTRQCGICSITTISRGEWLNAFVRRTVLRQWP